MTNIKTQMLKDQFPPGNYKYARHDAFKFKSNTEPLQLIIPAEHDQYTVALEPAHGKVIWCACVLSFIPPLDD